MPEIKMPQLGESVVEGTITRWLKQEGDTITEDDLLLEISTDKVDSEVPSSLSGTLQKILVSEGETVAVGTPIAVIGEGASEAASGDGAPSGADQAAAEPAAAEAPAPDTDEQGGTPQQARTGTAGGAEAQPEAEEQDTSDTTPAAAHAEGEGGQMTAEDAAEPADTTRTDGHDKDAYDVPSPDAPGGDTSKRAIISPLVRRLADENDVDLAQVRGSGTGGRIRKQDVMRFIEERKARPEARPAASAERAPEPQAAQPAVQPQAQPQPQGDLAPAAAATGPREELVPWSNIRRRTAEHMVAAHLETARAWNAVEVDWTNVVALRSQAKDGFRAREGFNLTYMPFLSRVVCDTLLEMPEVNSTFDEANQANLVKRYVNLGIAVALEGGGLIVPVVKGADERNLPGLARAINDVAARARSRKLTPDDLVGGSFTITNPGPFGSIISVPIIPKGQTAILAFEAIQKRVVVTPNDTIGIRSMGFLSMSWDHRTIDGAEAARFLARLRERIETTDFSSELSPYIS